MTTRNPFGVHFIPVHQGEHHYRFIQECEPGVVLLVSSNNAPDVQMMATMYERAPEAEHSYRNVPLSEEHDALWRDPVAAAIHHVSTWQNELTQRYDEAKRRGLKLPPREQIRTQGICEPVIELFARAEDMSNYGEWLAMMQQRTPLLDDYMSTYVWESKKYSLPCAVGIFSRGQPANLRPGDYATYDWFPKTRHAVEANPGFAIVGIHEYNLLAGPAADRDWYTYRWMHADWDCRFDVYEYGVWDNGYGWLNRLTATQYAAQTVEYIRHCQTDSRFGHACNFTLDGAGDWETWYIEPAMPEFVTASALLRSAQPTPTTPETPAATPPHTIHLPTVVNGPTPPTAETPQPQPADNWERSLAWVARWEGEYQNVANDVGNWTGGAVGVGENKGTKWGISAASYPQLDIKNLSREEAHAIFKRDYWIPSGASQLDWPACLVVFDTAILHGVGTATAWQIEVGTSAFAFAAKRLRVYTRLSNWDYWGKAWVQRVADLLEECAK